MPGLEKPQPNRRRRVLLLFVLLPLVTLVLASPWLLRAYRLWTVPDVPLPFDEAAVGTVVVSPDDNALKLY
jgi:hypothetical protein